MKMILRNLQLSKEDFKLLIGFEPTFVTLAPLSIFVTLLGLWGRGGNPEVVLAITPLAAGLILGGVAAMGIGAGVYDEIKAGQAAKEAAKPTPAERALTKEIAQIQTGTDAAAVDATIASGAVPIGAAIGAQQTGIAQQTLAADGGSGVPGSTFSGRGAALQRQLALEGTEALAGLSLGARKQGEEAAFIRQEGKHALQAQLGDLQSDKRKLVAGLRVGQMDSRAKLRDNLLGSSVGAATPSLATTAFSPSSSPPTTG